ncbi:heavy metal translocating P-type ATPase [Lactiplantibacillus mudanjiangensis]|uniref:P-type Cu(+) transporter n=1 Tax=Lactiplantibacillus mudanjiangensis TaxID=1296538 RepID=A0A660E6U9_9LACO|nr:heavy metal translocating P-type ATPase [Lactiplantibacillus mudanjiangensis]VDG21335.1 copper transporting ATPase [Lactobacillus plantarum JDM1] [Lactiplantibacillus mudanjiangensis]VDG23587.1 copper transporting ATPase [Lactobacillus plantarum JDM1] [Lactiplantibacillus mudanjiangensis]VDG28817.1 copper transporting ATPase [Lactobacillus plantarum JDM1] [Lactiplantibacillus mudanjiangensis]VDG32169.1 copper transporting ATPase [Lactobacillus plantarum JDM1] [Lactiplantibacillus mudanjiange
MKKTTMTMDHDHQMMAHDDMDMGNGQMMHMGNLKRKFWVSLVLTLPIILMSPMMGMRLPFQLIFQPWSDYLVAILGTIVFVYGGQPFFSGAKAELANRKPAMMTLITMGIGVAFVYSIYAVVANDWLAVTPRVTDFFWELVTLIDIMLLGHWIEMNTVMNAGSAVDKLAKLLPSTAHKIVDGQTQDVAIESLMTADHVQVRAGEKIPADGVIVSGATSVNEAMVTGEARLVEKQVDAKVVGGSVNGEGTFDMRVTGTGESGYLAQVMKLVSDAQAAKSAQENLADRVAGLLFYAALTVAIVAFIVWLLVGNLALALSIAVTVLVIACPHALGLAVPLVIARSTALAARHGLLIRNRDAMEQVKKLNYALMDKTGTLTAGDFKVADYQSLNAQYQADQVLSLMAGLEKGASHPLAVGILKAAKAQQVPTVQATDVHQITGVGLSGSIDGQVYQVVSAAYLDRQHLSYDQATFNRLASAGNSVSFLVQDQQVLGYVAQGDQLKPAAKHLIASLKAQHITPVMLTGDNEQSAQVVAKQLGITEVHASLLPEDKVKLVTQYQAQGQRVMMIGDGVNDAPSLAQADIGIAIGSGTDVAIDSADVVLVKSNPDDVVDFLALARQTTRKMTQNLWWGAGYNVITIPLAAGILAPWGFLLNPMVGAVVMSLSTIIVAINAMTLRLKD